MQCSKCGKTDRVTVGNRQYCANCGAVVSDAVTTQPAAVPVATTAPVTSTTQVAPTNPTQLTDIARRPTMADISAPSAPAPVTAQATTPVVKPSLLGKLFKKPVPAPVAQSVAVQAPVNAAMPISATPVAALPTASALTPTAPTVTPVAAIVNPAKAFHASPAPSKPAILDLRPSASKPAVSTQAVLAPEPTSTTTTVTPASAASAIAIPKTTSDRLVKAAATPKSDLIKKFGAGPTVPAVSVSASDNTAPAQVASVPVAPSASDSSSSVVGSRPRLEAPNPSVAASSDPLVNSAPSEIPPVALRQAETLKTLLPPEAEKTTPTRGLAGLKPSSVAAAAIAIAIMGGYIWVKNYPNYALKVASDQAGFEASLPNYLPGSFSLKNPIASDQGQVSLNFSSASDGLLTLKQTKTTWDSGSLLENFVAEKTSKYLAVQNHGLTIYLYNGNQATWVNHGIWYTLEGTAHLGRDQVFKIINSL